MSITYVKDSISKALSNVDSREKTLIVNGKYFLHQQKTVYAELSESKTVEFFIRIKKLDDNNNDITEKEYITVPILQKLDNIITSSTLGAFTLDRVVSEKLSHIIVDSTLDFLIIESALYHIARTAIAKNVINRELRTQDLYLSATELRALMIAFKNQSYDNYHKFIYNKSQRRVINRCYKKNRFYYILRAFVPVAVQYKHIYNPLLDDESDKTFMNSKLMQFAVKHHRKVEVNDDLSCYMLTHEEICKLLGLKKFMRFTPDFLYKFLVGLLHPELANFPTKTRKIFVKPASIEDPMSFNNVYSDAEFNNLLVQLGEEANNNPSPEQLKIINDKIQILDYYRNVDTLHYEIDRERQALLHIGAVRIESGITTDVLYEILAEGQLLMGDINEN